MPRGAPPADPRRREALEKVHEAACRAKQNSYVDPETGYFVMTAFFLGSRGYCCGAGCRHCPYPADVQAEAGRPIEAENIRRRG